MNKKAFTLVELIVVITILSVLATVAFISFQGYAASSRDSVRLSDIKSMEKVINLYRLTNSKYPTPNDPTNITYSGSTAWTQGVFGTNAYTKNTNLSDVPVDPITALPYAYSVTNIKKEYQIAAILEGEISASNTQTYAGNQIASVYVRGDYNGKIIRVRKDATDYILGVPSIIASDINDVRLETILTNQKLVYKGYSNLPASYSGSVYNANPLNGFSFSPNQVVLFEGDIDELEENVSKRLIFLSNIQTYYTGSIIEGDETISEILTVDPSSDSEVSTYIANNLNKPLNTKVIISKNLAINCIDTDIVNAKTGYVSGIQPNCILAEDGCDNGFIKYNNSCIIPGGLSLDKTSITFSDPSGSIVFGDSQIITLENTGEADYNVGIPVLNNTTNFQISSNNCSILGGGATCTIEIERQSLTGGDVLGNITIDGNIVSLGFNATGYTIAYATSTHSASDCIGAGGVITTISGDVNGSQVCKFTATTCPAGWSQAGSWDETSTRTCNGQNIPDPQAPTSPSLTLVESYDCPGNDITTGCTVNGHSFSKNGLDYCNYSQYFSNSSWSYKSETYFDTLAEAKSDDPGSVGCNKNTPSLSYSCYHYQPYNQKNRAYGYVHNSINNRYARVYWIAQSSNYSKCTNNYRSCNAIVTSIGCK